MQPDLEKQEDCAELTKELQRFVVSYEAEKRWSEKHPRSDLDEYGREPKSLGQLGCAARSDEKGEKTK